MRGRTILNKKANNINEVLLKLLEGAELVYNSIDSVMYLKFLNTLKQPGLKMGVGRRMPSTRLYSLVVLKKSSLLGNPSIPQKNYQYDLQGGAEIITSIIAAIFHVFIYRAHFQF